MNSQEYPTAAGTVRRPVRRSVVIDVVKGAAIVLVVMYHATLYLQHDGIDSPLGRALAVFALFPMPAFFLLAGLFSARQERWRFTDLVRRRLVPLLWLYVVWSVIRAAFYLLLPFLDGGVGELPARDLRSLALILVWPSSSYWFLYAMVLFALVAWLLRKLPVPLRLAAAIALSLAVGSGLLQTGNTGWDRMATYFVFFEAGVLFSAPLLRFITSASALLILPALLVLVLDGALLLFAGLRAVPGVVLIGQTAALACGLLICRLLAAVRPLAVLSTLGSRSLHIYLLHIFAIVPVAWSIGLAGVSWPRPVAFLITAALSAVVIWLSLLLARLTARVPGLYVPPRWLADLFRPGARPTAHRPPLRVAGADE